MDNPDSLVGFTKSMDNPDSTVGHCQSMDRVLDYLTGSFKVWTDIFAKSDLAKYQDMI